MTKAFDAIIIGAGQVGPPLARRLAWHTVPIHPTSSELVPTLLGDLQPL